MLGGVFVVWMLTAHGIYYATLGPEPPASFGAFFRDVFTTGAGWVMIIVGCAVGFLFAALVLASSVVSFPLLLDRDVGLPVAVITSLRVAAANPLPIAVWGLIVDGGPGDRVHPALPRPHRGPADPWPRHLAPLPPHGRGRPRARGARRLSPQRSSRGQSSASTITAGSATSLVQA